MSWTDLFRTDLGRKLISSNMGEKALYGYQTARSIAFTAQYLSLPFWELLATRQSKFFKKESFPHLQLLQKELRELLKKDVQNISEGHYPIEVLEPESWKDFAFRYPRIVMDGWKIARRRLQKDAKHFSAEARDYMNDVPEYFQRNFHFQSSGYLSDESAELYEHQVEILFAGAADAMRRLLLRPLKSHFPYSQGEGLHFLEIGAGTGRLSKFVKLVFPKARITLVDLSHPYLKRAQERLTDFNKLDFIQGDAASLQFKDATFDAVFSCFLFHELPLEIRRQVLADAMRVLKPGGFFGFVDALQEEDRREFNWALQNFPVDFHEPFFKNYIQNPMEGLFKAQGFQDIHTEFGFLSKVVTATKPN